MFGPGRVMWARAVQCTAASFARAMGWVRRPNTWRARARYRPTSQPEPSKISITGYCVATKNAILRTTPPLVLFSMIRCHLSTLMGREKLRISDVARLTGLNRSTVTSLYRETATRVDLPAIDVLCTAFKCDVGDLLEFIPDAGRAPQ
jgi:putative transcriptional regulator